ncbi:DUF4351 domain-containing protein [Biomaibacter acetigenes]|uniref:DUF4351 domain-containing protein n=1 Tax=Biomaibacter acetigenes TaxID=2316383 RepID=A0A3G2R4N7_9FIRM|nr:DUF4351 domain-containing protein [Biomaibacter acetigenes]AYO30315.1 DUF4351 domain-containing protein [Biomaibacter acetigenes]RKL62729.1 DUF4351 domain-containing protein [Thermoanaerobacteraceae bacterium SP2]
MPADFFQYLHNHVHHGGHVKKNFKEDAKIEQLNREYIRLDKTTAIADTVLSIEINEQKTKYHIEFQTINDRTLIIRMIDYGFRIAIDNLDYSKIKPDEEITVEFPSQIIIFLKHNESIPDELNLTIKMPYTEQKIKYIVPTFKIWKHDPDYYKRQKLYIMLPLRIINLSEELENLKKRKFQEEERTKLQNEYRRKITEVIESIIEELKDALKTNDLIIEECNKILLELSTLAGELFSEELKDIEQEVNEMAKMIIDPEIYRRGFEEGLEKRLEKGIEKGIERGVGKGMAETIIRQLCKKLGELPSEYKERILCQDRPTLELIAENIFDIESLSELDRFLKQ